MTRDSPAILLIGATGYTGRLIARELADDEAPFVLAARDPERLDELAAAINGGAVRVVDVTDPGSLGPLIRRGDVVINTAGPFTELGEPVIEACIAAGAHYLDTSGEQTFMRAMHERHHDAARRAGVAMVNGMAFEFALGDCAIAVLADELGAPLRSVDVTYAWGAAASSIGTRRTSLRIIGHTAWFRRGGRYYSRPQGSGRRVVEMASGRRLHAIAFGSGEVVTAPRHLDVEDVRGWLVTGAAKARLARLLAPTLPVVVPLLRPFLDRLVALAPEPTHEERQDDRFTIRVEVEADGVGRALELQGRDPYGTTATVARHAARLALAGDVPAGVLAPAQLVDPLPFLESLADRGLRLVPDTGR
jgi:short subunit dehydrogenase-like uncharacterized protein